MPALEAPAPPAHVAVSDPAPRLPVRSRTASTFPLLAALLALCVVAAFVALLVQFVREAPGSSGASTAGRRAEAPAPPGTVSGLRGAPVRAPLVPRLFRLEWGRPFQLKDSPETITVTPVVSPLENGGFLVADAREAQVRVYSPKGDLLRYFGRRGPGPHEFVALSNAVPLSGGRVLTTDMNGKVNIFTDAGELLSTDRAPLSPLYGAVPLDDSTVILRGRSREGPTLLLHLWDLRHQRVRASFFPVPDHPERLRSAYVSTSFPAVAVRGGTIAATFPYSREVTLMDLEGRVLRTIPIPFQNFRQLTEPPPASENPADYQRWVETHSVVSQLFWRTDGTFLVQYYNVRGLEPQWNLLVMDGQGNRLYEEPGPKLHALIDGGATLLFDDPDSDDPAVWARARVLE